MNSAKETFSQKAPGQKPPGPLVLVNAGYDDPARGDCHSIQGIGRAIMKKTDGRFLYADAATLKALFPKEKEYSRQLALLLEKHGKPDIVFETIGANLDTRARLPREKGTFYIATMAEHFVDDYITPDARKNFPLAAPSPHHLDDQTLKTEGEKFDAHYSDLPKPLIGVHLVDGYGEYDAEKFAQKLASICANYPVATIFICTGRKTPPNDYKDMMKAVTKKIVAAGLSDRVKIRGHNFARAKTAYNPYIGLLARADHQILYGPSRSIAAEILAAGKLVYFNLFTLTDWEKAGYAYQFEDWPKDKPLSTNKVTPPDITAAIADGVIQVWRQKNTSQKQKISRKGTTQPDFS